MALHRPRSAAGFVLGFLSIAVLALSLSGCSKPAAPVAAAGPPAVSVGKSLTDKECLEVAEAISQAASSGDEDALDRLIDWDALYQRCTAGIDAPEKFRMSFVQGLDQSRVQHRGVANGVVNAVKKGGSYTLLHSHTKDNRRWLLFRLQLPEAGLNYHDLLLARRPDGKVKVVDMHVYMSGELLSETFRRAYIQAAAQANGGLVDRLTGADQKFVKYFEKLGDMAEAGRNGKYAEVLNIYKSLPPDIKMEKSLLIVRLGAAQNVGDDKEYSQSIEDFRTAHPNDACIDILSIDYYLLKKQYREALDCIDRVDRALEGDPFLETFRANIHTEQDDLVAARADLKRALDADPGMTDAYWSLIGISLKEKNHDETLKTLRLLRDKFGIAIGDLTATPLYKEFAESPQYQELLKDKPVAAEKPNGKEPAGEPKE
jgi:tetratricopeptide (TPR) repeat protein